MKTTILTFFLIIILSLNARAHGCFFTSCRNGITIIFNASCEQKDALFADSLLNNILFRLNRKDTNIKILVLINDYKLHYPNSKSKNFLSLSIDTIREIDDDFIANYYWEKERVSMRENGSNHFESRFEPIDINLTNIKASTQIGLKIIYNKDYRLGEPALSDLEKIILCSFNNYEFIRKNQTIDTVQYFCNGWYVSLLSLNPYNINKSIAKTNVNNVKVKPLCCVGIRYLIFIFFVICIGVSYKIWKYKHSR